MKFLPPPTTSSGSTQQKTIHVAVIGCGYWGLNYVRVFNEIPGARVVAVCEQREQRLAEIADIARDVNLHTSLDSLFAEEAFDAAVICTEASGHYGVARQCLQAGKHLLVEKPFASTASEALELTELAERIGCTLLVGHTFVYNSGIRKMKDCIDQAGGRIYYLHSSRTNLGPIRRDVNALWDLATHDVAIFNYLIGSTPFWVTAVGAKVLRNGKEDVGFMCLGYRDGIVGHIHVSWADPYKAREVVAVCSDRRIAFNDLNTMEQVRVYDKGVAVMSEPTSYGEYQLRIRDGDIHSPKIESKEPLKEQCRHFLHCVLTGETPITSGRDGTEVLRVMEAVDRSMSSGGAPVSIIRDEIVERNHVIRSSEPVRTQSAAR